MKKHLPRRSFRVSLLSRLFSARLPLLHTEAIWAIAGIFLGLPFALFFIQILIPVTPGSIDSQKFSVEQGVGSYEIASRLKDDGLIRSETSFFIYAFITGRASGLQSGEYLLSPAMSTHEIIRALSTGNTVEGRITIPEGWDLRAIAQEFERQGIFTQEEFFAVTGYPAIDYRENTDLPRPKDFSNEFPILRDKPDYVSLEGYIFPDTYHITASETPERFVRRAIQNLQDSFTPDMLAQVESQGKTIFETITWASLAEKEVPSLKDKRTVVGVLQKRLENDVRLQVDATVVYVREGNYYKVTIGETQIESPYNTYRVDGLPLGPITNPGLESIEAALTPTESPYWFYLSARDGTTIFSRDFEEHTAAKNRYLR